MTPEEIRAKALECAALTWGPGGVTSYQHVLITAREFEAYIAGAPESKPKNILVPLPGAEQPREHLDHDGDLWGALCAGCAHSLGIHKYAGCHYVKADMSYCDCDSFTEVRPAAVTPEPSAAKCICHEHTHRYGVFTNPDRCLHPGCGCRWMGGLAGEPTTAGCTCEHMWQVHEEYGCELSGCDCKWAGGQTAEPSADRCTCNHARMMHGEHGCGYLGECDCKWRGEGP